MKIQYLSDLHVEFGSRHLLYYIKQCESDIIVIAGDLHTSRGIIETLRTYNQVLRKHIIFVCGNHEYYYTSKMYLDELLREFDDHPYVHILNNQVFFIDDLVFLGSTGWYTMNTARNAVKSINDYYYISDIKANNDGLNWGWISYKFFNENLKKYFGRKIICVSHNAPTVNSIPEQFQGSELNSCFVNAWEHLILFYKPDIWIHGHTHETMDYTIGNTKILCNPYGYKMDRNLNKNFNPQKTLNF